MSVVFVTYFYNNHDRTAVCGT